MRKLPFIIAITLLGNIAASGQDIHFSQFYMAPLAVNPGLSGAEYDIRALVNYRTQWKSVGTPYNTMAAAYDMKFVDKKKQGSDGNWAAGLLFFNDRAGDSKMRTTQANLSAAYHLVLDKHMTLGLGVQGGFFQRSYSDEALQWGNQFDGYQYNTSYASNENPAQATDNFAKGDLSAGLVWTYKKGDRFMTSNDQINITAGLALKHINRPKYTYYQAFVDDKLYRRIVGHVHAEIGIQNTKFTLNPAILYMRQGPNQDIYGGLNVMYKLSQESKYTGLKKGSSVALGVFYRNGDAIAITSMLTYSNYTIGASYDINISSLKVASNSRGAFELALRYVFPNPFGGGGSSKARFN
ncbi:MAG: PorP/SprF family type IX secretion system membrane protein [Flavobacteriales bacterium]|nr:PorP/SprF family type IX secretion system membrane protein [Flavobacteriales bacterium]